MSTADGDANLGCAEQELNAHMSKDAPLMNTVGKAKSAFRDYGTDLSKEYESVVAFCRKNSIGAPLQNGNYLHALTLTNLLFSHCDKSLRMMTGGEGNGFISCLEATFIEMLERLKKKQRFSASYRR